MTHISWNSKINPDIATFRMHPLPLLDNTPCTCAEIGATSIYCAVLSPRTSSLSVPLLGQQLSQHVVQDATILKVSLLDLK